MRGLKLRIGKRHLLVSIPRLQEHSCVGTHCIKFSFTFKPNLIRCYILHETKLSKTDIRSILFIILMFLIHIELLE